MGVTYTDLPTAYAKLAEAVAAGTCKTFRTKYAGRCAIHGGDLPLGTLAHSPERGAVVCHPCYVSFERGETTETTAEAEAPAASFAPTGEQQDALGIFATGVSFAIEAGAGTGKTSTLKLLAASTPRRGQYLAFNRAIVQEAKAKMPSNVRCDTAHSLAFHAVGKPFAHRLSSPRMRSEVLAGKLGMDSITVQVEGGEKRLSAAYLAGLAMRAITRFCQTADEAPGAEHVPYIDGIDSIVDGQRTYGNNRQVARYLAPRLVRAWADLTDPNGSLPYKHEHYLKLWQLSDPHIAADYILFDEAQDANPVMVAIVAAQTHAQLVWVGDSQQQIYSFTGAVNALQNIPTDARTYLTQSFRFGPAVADQANVVLGWLDAELRLLGTETIASQVVSVADPDCILTRTNAAAVRAVLNAQRDGKRAHLVGGGEQVVSFAKAAQRLMDGARTEHPELACFETWGEVIEYVEQDEQGGDLRLLVSLIEEFTVATILDALDRVTPETTADLIVSTAHKSKGREWNAVKLADDFPEDRGKVSDEELRLLYVAVTRAKLRLDITNVALLVEGMETGAAVAAPAA